MILGLLYYNSLGMSAVLVLVLCCCGRVNNVHRCSHWRRHRKGLEHRASECGKLYLTRSITPQLLNKR